MNKSFHALFAAMLLSGCASIERGSTQQFLLFTRDDQHLAETACTLSNDAGQWSVHPVAPVTIARSGDPLQIRCENPTQIGALALAPNFQDKYLFQDLMLDLCFPACLIDSYYDAFYEYPSHVSVPMLPKP